MAYDKVVDSAALDAMFTGIANGLRDITGEAGTIKDTEMQDKVNGIGAEVSNQTDLIEQIKAVLEGKAGGSGDKFTWGSYTPESNTSARQTITHGLGEKPLSVIILACGTSFSTSSDNTVFYNLMTNGAGAVRMFAYSGKVNFNSMSVSGASKYFNGASSNPDCAANITDETFDMPQYLLSANTYVWVATSELLPARGGTA